MNMRKHGSVLLLVAAALLAGTAAQMRAASTPPGTTNLPNAHCEERTCNGVTFLGKPVDAAGAEVTGCVNISSAYLFL